MFLMGTVQGGCAVFWQDHDRWLHSIPCGPIDIDEVPPVYEGGGLGNVDLLLDDPYTVDLGGGACGGEEGVRILWDVDPGRYRIGAWGGIGDTFVYVTLPNGRCYCSNVPNTGGAALDLQATTSMRLDVVVGWWDGRQDQVGVAVDWLER